MIDEEGRDEDNEPAAGIQGIQSQSCRGAHDIPDDPAHGLPFPEQQEQCDTGKEHVGTSFDGSGHEAGPRGLEPWSGHDAVLKSE